MRLVIIGGGGHGRVVTEAAYLSGQTDIVVVDPHRAQDWPLSIATCVASDEEAGLNQTGTGFVIAIGNNTVRQALFAKYAERSLEAATIIHPAACVSPSATVGPGSMIMAGSIVGPLAKLGRGVIINHGAIAEHDTIIGDFSHLAPGAVIAGAARIGKRSFLGANSCVRHGAEIRDDIVLGHGAVAAKSITEPGTYVGNPARPIEKQKASD